MNKFLSIVSFSWQRVLTFRFTVFMYRFGEVIESLVLCFMWLAIYANAGVDGAQLIKGFTIDEMVTYVFIGTIFINFTRSFASSTISRDIFDGTLSMSLVRPISYIRYVFYDRLGSTSFVILVGIIGQTIAMLFFMDHIIANTDYRYWLIIVPMLALAFMTEYFINTLVGFIAFWADDVDGLFSTLDRIRRFFSGGYFPLSILPAIVGTISMLLPFAYTFYVPTQLYLKKISLLEGVKGLGIQVVWVFVLYGIVKFVWYKGIRKYEGVGL